MGRRPRCARGCLAVRALCAARHDRLYGAGRLWRLAAGPRLRRGLVPAHRGGGLGTLQHGPLGMGGAVGLDLDRRRPLGVCAFALWTLGILWQPLGLGAGSGGSAAVLCAGRGRLHRRRQHPHRQRAGRGLVSAGAARRLSPRVPGQPPVCHTHQQHHGQQHVDARRRPGSLDEPQRAGGDHGYAFTQFRGGASRAAWQPS